MQSANDAAGAAFGDAQSIASLGELARLHDTVVAEIPSGSDPDVGLYWATSRAFAVGVEGAVQAGDDWSAFTHMTMASLATCDVNMDVVLAAVTATCPSLDKPELWITPFDSIDDGVFRGRRRRNGVNACHMARRSHQHQPLRPMWPGRPADW